MKHSIFIIGFIFFNAVMFSGASAMDVWNCTPGTPGCQVTRGTSSTAGTSSAPNCLAKLNGRNGCFQTSGTQCLVGFEYCTNANCGRNGGEWDQTYRRCVEKGTLASDQPKATPDTVADCEGDTPYRNPANNKCERYPTTRGNNPAPGTEGAECPSGNDRECNNGLSCQVVGKDQQADIYACKKKVEKAASGSRQCSDATNVLGSKGQCASDEYCNFDFSQNSGVCEKGGNAGVVSNEPSAALTNLIKNQQECQAKSDIAAKECDDETSKESEKFRSESRSLLGQLGQVQKSAGAVGAFQATSNALLGVEVGMQAMKLACEQKAGDCARACEGAKKQEAALLKESGETRPDEAGALKKVKGDLADSVKSCKSHEGAIASIAKAILENGIARMSANINGDCLSNKIPPDMQYCCGKTNIPATCFQGPYDPNGPATAWNPGPAPTNNPATTPACLANPTGPGCQVAAKVTDVPNGGVSGLNTGMTGGASGRGAGGGTPNFNFADDPAKGSDGAMGKPTAMIPPGGEGGGGGGGLGGGGGGMGGGSGGGGGGSAGGGGGHEGGGSGDSLFDGMRAVGSSDPNRFGGGGGGGGSGGANALALNGGKAGAMGKTVDGKAVGGYPDLSKGFEAFKGNKSGLRGIAGATGPDGITGPDTNIWKKINNAVLNDQIYLAPLDAGQRK